MSEQAADGDPVTLLLRRVEAGDRTATEQLLALVYDELRKRAGRLMAAERKDHTLQRTALVHEAFMRLVKPGASFQDRLHFFNAAALAMRRILLDHADARRRQKRGGGKVGQVNLDQVDEDAAPADRSGNLIDIMSLDEALTRLAQRSPRQAQIVNLRYFVGLKDAEIAQLLGVSEKSVQRHWATARVWLYGEVSK